MEKQKKNLAVIVALAIIYFVAGKLGLTMAFVHPSATAVWPCTGIALAAFLILGYDLWPGVLLAAFLANSTTAGSVATCLCIATGNTLEGLAGAYLVNRFAGGQNAMHRPQDVFKFAGFAGMLSTCISATFGVTSLALGGYASWANYRTIWSTWWLGDAVGAVIIAPLLMLWILEPRPRWRWTQCLEAVSLLVCVVLVGLIVFDGFLVSGTKSYPLEYLCIPFLIWAGFGMANERPQWLRSYWPQPQFGEPCTDSVPLRGNHATNLFSFCSRFWALWPW